MKKSKIVYIVWLFLSSFWFIGNVIVHKLIIVKITCLLLGIVFFLGAIFITLEELKK